jgi:hypothetical protein
VLGWLRAEHKRLRREERALALDPEPIELVDERRWPGTGLNPVP